MKYPQSHHCKHTRKKPQPKDLVADKQVSMRFFTSKESSRDLGFYSAAETGPKSIQWKWHRHWCQNIQWSMTMLRLFMKYCSQVNQTHTYCKWVSVRKDIFQHQLIKTNVSKNASLKKSAQNTGEKISEYLSPLCNKNGRKNRKQNF